MAVEGLPEHRHSVSELATELLRAVEEDGSLRLNAAFGEAVGSDNTDDIEVSRESFIDYLRALQKVP
jgi:hypothetical protein